MSLASTIESAVQIAFDAIGDLKKQGFIVKELVKAYDPVTDCEIKERFEYEFAAVELDTEQTENLNRNVVGVSFYVLAKIPEDVIPEIQDKIRFDANEYEIKYVHRLQPGTKTLLWTIGVAQ